VTKGASTLDKILQYSKWEFLQNGFKNASLRNIAAEAGLTTGAIYGYFKDKNAIFETLVASAAEQVEKIFPTLSRSNCHHGDFISEKDIQKNLDALRRIYHFIYENLDEFRLLFCCAEGSSKANFVHTIVDHEVTRTIAALEQIKTQRDLDFQIDKTTIHIISDSYINALLEPIRHNMDRATAMINVELLGRFYTAGWKHILRFTTDKSLT